MKVLLVHLVPPASHFPIGEWRTYCVPTGVAYIAAALKRAAHEVRVLVQEELLIKNGFDRADADRRLRRVLEEFRPEMIGLSVFTPALPEAARVADVCKELLGAGVLVVAGGPHPTAVAEWTLEDCPAVDVAAVGEGEATMVELAASGPGEGVRGIVFRRDGRLVRTPPRPPERDLDSLGGPAYELFDLRHYATANPWTLRWLKMPATNIRTSRGCSNRCAFCAGHLVGGLGVRTHSVQFVLEQIRFAVDRMGASGVHFEDDTLGADRTRLLELCEAIRRCGLDKRIVWDGCLRVDQVDAELLAAMKSAGCIQVEYGFESGSDASLKGLGKNATLELNRRAVMLTRQAGLRIFGDIMVGLPGERPQDVKATMEFIRWARPEVLVASRLSPLPGTAVFNRLPPEVQRSIDWAEYSYMNLHDDRLNLTAMDNKTCRKVRRAFMHYFAKPLTAAAQLRDSDPSDVDYRRRLKRRLRRFVIRHPLRAMKLPWPT